MAGFESLGLPYKNLGLIEGRFRVDIRQVLSRLLSWPLLYHPHPLYWEGGGIEEGFEFHEARRMEFSHTWNLGKVAGPYWDL